MLILLGVLILNHDVYNVTFPGLGLSFKVDPIAFTIGSFSVYWYGIIIAVGFTLALSYCISRTKKHNIDTDKFTDCIIVGLITAIIGARAYYVAFSWDKYKDNLSEIFNVHGGGLAIYGGIIGAVIGGLIMAKIQKVKILPLLDVAAGGFLIGQGIGRWGNFMNQEAFGSETSLPWRMVSEGTGGVAVHPCFLYESLWCLIGVLILHFVVSKRQRYNGQLMYFYLVWYGFERTIVEGLRADSLYLPFADIRVSQLISLVMVIVGVVMLIIHRKTADECFVEAADSADTEKAE